MSEVELFIIFVLIGVVPFILGGITRLAELRDKKPTSLLPFKITIEPLTTQTNIVVHHPIDNTIFEEAVELMVNLGFTKTESKKTLKAVGSHSTVEDWVKAALETIKI